MDSFLGAGTIIISNSNVLTNWKTQKGIWESVSFIDIFKHFLCLFMRHNYQYVLSKSTTNLEMFQPNSTGKVIA